MSYLTKRCVCIAIAVSLAALTGCRKSPDKAAPPAASPDTGAQPPATPAPAPPATEEPAADAQGASLPQIEAALAKLSPEDRALALKQQICPVSDEPLGAMGPPIKVEVAGQVVFICCEPCRGPLTENPEEHLAKIGLKPVAETAPQ